MKSKSRVVLRTGGLLILVGLLAFTIYRLATHAAFDFGVEPKGLTQHFMQRKSAAALRIRDGLNRESFRRTMNGVRELRRVSEASNWFLPDDRYTALSDDYRTALKLTEVAVSQQDALELAEAYNQLVRSCTRCHQEVASSQIDLGLELN